MKFCQYEIFRGRRHGARTTRNCPVCAVPICADCLLTHKERCVR